MAAVQRNKHVMPSFVNMVRSKQWMLIECFDRVTDERLDMSECVWKDGNPVDDVVYKFYCLPECTSQTTDLPLTTITTYSEEARHARAV